MASGKPPLAVITSPDAEDDLIEIWGTNVEIYRDVAHADRFVTFIRAAIKQLATNYDDAKTVTGLPEFRFITMRKSRRGHGHYVIFEVDEIAQVITVLRIYHTRMDIQERLKNQFR